MYGLRAEEQRLSDDWMKAWEPMVAAVGTDFGGPPQAAIDVIELGAVRKFCEPVEMDCPLFFDEQIARAHGYEGVPAPISGISQTWLEAGIWRPGNLTPWPAPDRDAMPQRPIVAGGKAPPQPPTTAAFATDIEIEYHQTAYVGDRLSASGNRLISCQPKETSVGRGAFMIYESYVHNQREELIATVRRGLYQYLPHAG